MIVLTAKQKEFICNNFKNAESLMKSDDLNDVLDALDDLMLVEGFNKDDEPNERGLEIERIRDEIYANN